MAESDFAALGERSTLFLQPHVQLLALGYPVDELVLAVHQANPATDAASNAVSDRRAGKRTPLPSMRRSATFLAVHRFEDTVYYRRLDREAYLLLASLQKGSALGEAIESAFADSKLPAEEQAAKIQACFAHAAELGWFCASATQPRVTEQRAPIPQGKAHDSSRHGCLHIDGTSSGVSREDVKLPAKPLR